ncbi:MAG TPA: phosphoenolpyruvate--protein phosphotransferase [Rhizomicrobium sp.]|nr:phosphoenolpyruvate--protein phosphotransferase [Rhizomicrobium sp.]
MTNLLLMSPMDGWVSALKEVPDPVFSENILGDGLAIDPVAAVVRAPCDGVIVQAARHAVTLRAANGAEILIHVGLETVALNGQGFIGEVAPGRSVKTGDALLRFDMDVLFDKAKSLITPVVLTNGDAFRITRRALDCKVATGEFLMEIAALRADATAEPAASTEARRDIQVLLAHGLHARPAARLAGGAKRFAAEIALVRGPRRVNAKSVVALMSLGVKHGETVAVHATGPDAEAAVATLAGMIAEGLGETPSAPKPVVEAPRAAEPGNILRGVCASPGLAVGPAFQLKIPEIAVPEQGCGVPKEMDALDRALSQTRVALEAKAASGNRQQSGIVAAHVALLDDPEIIEEARSRIEHGKSAGFAWRGSVRQFAAGLSAMDDALMRERANDLLDLEAQVVARITGAVPAVPQVPDGAILLASDFLPSQVMGLKGAAGLCSAGGGPTSHVAILAAGMNLPALAGAGEAVTAIADGTMLILDAGGGALVLAPDEAALSQARSAIAAREVRSRDARAHALEQCRTADGTRIEIFANLGSGADEASAAIALGAEGCGLLRTEFLFHDHAPGEDEQAATYQAIASALQGRPLIVRCFDIGGDKPVPYLPFPHEDNPALGMRGIRLGLAQPDLLKTQLAAIARVTPRPSILLPMISSLAELREVRAMLGGEARLGAMIETPASAVLASVLAREADFLSIGTNDLTQYTLAMDRGNPQLAPRIDAFHPAVLRLIAQAASGAREHGKPAAMCGGLAADPIAVPLLIGFGLSELSVPPAAVPEIKAVVRRLDIARCRDAAERALQLATAEEIRALAKELQP